jgi:hypothetical protein
MKSEQVGASPRNTQTETLLIVFEGEAGKELIQGTSINCSPPHCGKVKH